MGYCIQPPHLQPQGATTIMSNATEAQTTNTEQEKLQVKIAEHIVEQQLIEDPALKTSPYRVEEAAESAMNIGGIVAKTIVEKLQEQREKAASTPSTPSL
jgi:hypothetical protein